MKKIDKKELKEIIQSGHIKLPLFIQPFRMTV